MALGMAIETRAIERQFADDSHQQGLFLASFVGQFLANWVPTQWTQ
jgi:hypothetical protein